MIVSELIELLFEHDLDSRVTVFFDRYDGGGYKQGEENPVLIASGGVVVIATESEKDAAEYWDKQHL